MTALLPVNTRKLAELRETMPDGTLPAYAWPGGYQLVYYTAEGLTICPVCANDPDTSDPVADAEVYWEGPPIVCNDKAEVIESAYGDPEPEAEARKLGAEAGRAAASWYEVSAENASTILQGIADGDPAVLDTFPSAPLSGEWSGDPLPADILAELGAADMAPEVGDELLTAYEDAYSDAAWDEIERMARVHYAGPHVVGSITCDCGAMSTHTPSITYPAP